MTRTTQSSVTWADVSSELLQRSARCVPGTQPTPGNGSLTHRTRSAVTAWVRATGVLLLAVLTVTGCTAEAEPQQASSSSEATPSRPSAVPSATTSKPPSPDEQAAEIAIETFEGLLQVSDAASREPNARDWETEIRRYAADPAALLTVQAVRDYATLGLRQEGDSVVDLQVTGVDLSRPEGPTVRITGCYDSQSARTINVATSEVVPPGTPPRYVWDITVVQFVAEPGQPWLVTSLEPLTDRPC